MRPLLPSLPPWFKKGSVTVEFVISLIFASFCFLITLELLVFALGSELASYAAYISSRALKVNPDSSVPNQVRSIVPWVNEEGINYGTDGTTGWVRIDAQLAHILGEDAFFSILDKELGLNVYSETILAPQDRKACEDNPLWYAVGDDPC